MNVVRFSALRLGRLYHQEIFLVLISVRGWVNLHGHSAARRIMSMKNSYDTIGNRTRDNQSHSHNIITNCTCFMFRHRVAILRWSQIQSSTSTNISFYKYCVKLAYRKSQCFFFSFIIFRCRYFHTYYSVPLVPYCKYILKLVTGTIL